MSLRQGVMQRAMNILCRHWAAARGSWGRGYGRWHHCWRGRNRYAAIGMVSLSLCLALSLLPRPGRADDSLLSSYEGSSGLPSPAGSELSDLLRVLDEQSEVARSTRLNVDRLPGIISVYYGEDLRDRGSRTVFEALELVPGVQTSITGTGLRQVIMRGAGKVRRSGKIKILLNGVEANSSLSGEAPAVFAIPLEQVDRIEVIRGPGSALHGEYAYVGVINVITRKDRSELFLRANDHGGYTGGGALAYELPDRDLSLSLNFAGFDTDGANPATGPDALFNTSHEQLSNAPGRSRDNEELQSVFFGLDYRDSFLRVQFLRSALGDFFGGANVLPDPNERVASDQEWWNVNTGGSFRLSADSDLGLELGLSVYREDVDYQILPSGFEAGPFEYPEGMFFGFGYPDEKRFWSAASLRYRGFDKHRILSRLRVTRVEASDFFQRANFDPQTFEPFDRTVRSYGEDNFLDEGKGRRTVLSAVVQDEISVSANLTVTAGARFDDYSDVGNNFSPRVAAVFELSDHHRLKAQFAEAFRPPSFLELYSRGFLFSGDPGLKPETVRTLEAGYIYDSGLDSLSVTLSYSDFYDTIVRGEDTFANGGDARVMAAELDFSHRFDRALRLQGSLSFSDSDDDANGGRFPDVAQWSGNVAWLYTPRPGRRFSLQYRYLGERPRAVDDERPGLAAEHVLDATARFDRIFSSSFNVSLGVKNLSDESVFAPAPPGTYPGDYPRAGREFWGAVAYEF